MTMTEPVTIRVYGTPAPQGSKRAFAVRKGGVPTGKVAVIESSHDRVKAWRQAVIDEAVKVKDWPALDWPALDGPLLVVMTFWLRRPTSHYGTGRNACRIKPGAPQRPARAPDLSKLIRATEDALKDAGIIRDDCIIVSLGASKHYDDQNDPGAEITISQP
jgi:Holliday junction resolvase RusA-like endonuclease